MDILLQNTTLQYRAIGGIFDFYIYTGPSPKDVVQQYVSSIGLPTMHQYWALGYHQCRWGYNNISALEDVVKGYKDANIPLETIWTDIDCTFVFRTR
jgi:alpha-glucosidase